MAVARVQKNSGYIQKFSLAKLKNSIRRALKHTDIYDEDRVLRIAKEVRQYLDTQGKKQISSKEIRAAVKHIMDQDEPKKLVSSYELSTLHLEKTRIIQVLKRNGTQETFEPIKLFKSIKKSFSDNGKENVKFAEELTKETIKMLENKTNETIIPVELIRKTVHDLLKKHGLHDIERSYLLHKYL